MLFTKWWEQTAHPLSQGIVHKAVLVEAGGSVCEEESTSDTAPVSLLSTAELSVSPWRARRVWGRRSGWGSRSHFRIPTMLTDNLVRIAAAGCVASSFECDILLSIAVAGTRK